MVNNYYDFITEKVTDEYENIIIFSDKFRGILTGMDNDISKSLLKIEKGNLNVRLNYIDSTDKNDTVSFIPVNKAREIFLKNKNLYTYTGGNGRLKHSDSNSEIFELLGYVPEGKESYKPTVGEISELVNKVTSDKSGKTYAYMKFKNGVGVYNINIFKKGDENTIKLLWNTNRQEIGIGKLTRLLLTTSGINVNNTDLENFINLYKTKIDKLNDRFSLFEIVSGDKISFYYNSKNYYSLISYLGNSCMSRVPSSYFEIYTKNPEVCSLVILKSIRDESKIVGRALLWVLSNGKKFLDRKYTNKDHDIDLFHEFAKMNGWYSKRNNNSSASGYAYDPNGNVVDISQYMTIPIKNLEYNNYPYVDTFKYYNYSNNTLSIDSDGEYYLLEDTYGGYVDDCCQTCGGTGRISCYNCDGYGDLECDVCDGSGEVEDDDGSMVKCDNCDGSGRVRCDICYGDGRLDCPDCN